MRRARGRGDKRFMQYLLMTWTTGQIAGMLNAAQLLV